MGKINPRIKKNIFPRLIANENPGVYDGDVIRLVCPQTFSHTVMCKVCLAASKTLFDADAFVQLNN